MATIRAQREGEGRVKSGEKRIGKERGGEDEIQGEGEGEGEQLQTGKKA